MQIFFDPMMPSRKKMKNGNGIWSKTEMSFERTIYAEIYYYIFRKLSEPDFHTIQNKHEKI